MTLYKSWCRPTVSILLIFMLGFAFSGFVFAAPPWERTGGGDGDSSESSVMPTYSGRATALSVSVNLLLSKQLVLSDTGELNSTGEPKDEALLEINKDVVSASVLKASTVGSGNQTDSMAVTTDLDLDLSSWGIDLRLSASVLEAAAHAECVDGSEVFHGYSHIANLTINGYSIEKAKEPNTKIALDGLVEVYLNEQTTTDNGMEVTALRVVVLNLHGKPVAEVIVSRARAGITCGSGPDGECPKAGDFVTGGGFFHDGYKVNFGMHGGIFPNGNLMGGFNLVTSGHHIRSSRAVDYRVIDLVTREVDYEASDSGSATSCTIRVADNGEPGRYDTFAIYCTSGYSASGQLSQGGNVQLHMPRACDSNGKTNNGKGKKH